MPWQLFWGENKGNPAGQCNRTPYIYSTWGVLGVRRVLEEGLSSSHGWGSLGKAFPGGLEEVPEAYCSRGSWRWTPCPANVIYCHNAGSSGPSCDMALVAFSLAGRRGSALLELQSTAGSGSWGVSVGLGLCFGVGQCLSLCPR